jgi:hypothetical protein
MARLEGGWPVNVSRVMLGLLGRWPDYSVFAGLLVGLCRGHIVDHMAYGLLTGYVIRVILLDLGAVRD